MAAKSMSPSGVKGVTGAGLSPRSEGAGKLGAMGVSLPCGWWNVIGNDPGNDRSSTGVRLLAQWVEGPDFAAGGLALSFRRRSGERSRLLCITAGVINARRYMLDL